MKRVFATIDSTCGRDSASSNDRAAGVIPKRYRIHAACRASTEWIDTAATSNGFAWMRAA